MRMCISLDVSDAAEIVRSFSIAVAHLHHMNIAHRDLKVLECVSTCMNRLSCDWSHTAVE